MTSNAHRPTRSLRVAPLALLLVFLGPDLGRTAAAQAPRSSPLDEAGTGRVLLDALRCASCHAGLPEPLTPSRPAPDLAEAGWRIAPEYLKRFVRDPAAVHPGTRMPAMLAGMPPARADDVAEALTHFLVSRADRKFARTPVAAEDVAAGADLYHRIGCVACHGPRRPAQEGEPTPRPVGGDVSDLVHVRDKYGLDSLADFLFRPRRLRPEGRMPDMGLSRREARAIASYLIGADAPRGEPLSVRPELAEAGAQHFASHCAACHALDGVTAPPANRRRVLRPDHGCLSPADSTTPRYTLDEDRRRALAKAIDPDRPQLSERERVAATLIGFRCTACHGRNGYGGPTPELAPYFGTDEPNLGDHARIPPRLTLAGAKLRPEWLRKVLFDGAAVRPYMHTRMPRFGEENLGRLPALLAEVDHVEPFEMPVYKRKAASTARDAGRKLLGSRGLNCVACHDFNGRPSPAMSGIDLIDSCERLEPGWFKAFLVAPQKYRPGIVMPEYWPGGKASHPILDGDTEAQIRAIWFYLAAGRTARIPEGLAPRPSRLEVEGRTRTYRGRSRIAGYRGIAVGFPGGVNYAFNAHTGTLSGLWRGAFVSVRWDGQGAGDFNPAARAIQLAQDLSLFRLPDAEAPWPLRPVKTKEQPVNPDPLYPRNRGYRFKGYHLDEADVPTFRYESGAIAVEDRSVGRMDRGRALLTRVLRFTAPAAETVWFRALAGDVEAVAPRRYELGKLQLTIPDTRAILRRTQGAGSELLLELAVPAGASEWTLEYEIDA